MRKFSLTSSQAHKSFVEAFPAFKQSNSWIAVAEYLYGPSWEDILLPNQADNTPPLQNENETDDEADNFIPPPTIHKYINEIIPPEGDLPTYQALRFIKKYVGSLSPDSDEEEDSDSDEEAGIEGSVVQDARKAKEIVDNLDGPTRKQVLSLLGKHVQQNHRKNQINRKDLEAWLLEPNHIRNFWFYKHSGLKELAQAQGLDLGKGRKTIGDLRKILANPADHQPAAEIAETATTQQGGRRRTTKQRTKLPPKDEATRAILERSFLPHQKGKAREHCTLGHRLELPILKNWIELTSENNFPCPGLKVKGAYSAGLAAKKDAIYAKDSIDYIIFVEEEDGQDLKPWGFEAKGRVTARTAAEEERNLHYYNNPHVSISADKVFEEVANEGERFQVLQHALVYDFEKVVLAISDESSTLIRSTIISFENNLKNHFGTVLKEIMGFSLKWAYPDAVVSSKIIKVPQNIIDIAADIPTINGAETLQGAANIWYSLSLLPRPIPSFVRMIPAVCAFWNAVKGGSDTTTKLMDDCILRVPKAHLNTETAACTRIISLLFVLIHRLYQVVSAEEISSYLSLKLYRKAASERSTYHVCLMRCRKVFLEQLKKNKDVTNDENNECNNAEEQESPPRFVKEVDGRTPELTTFGAQLVTKTPTKMSQLAKKNKLSSELQSMISECSGIPMKSYPVTYGKCGVCNQKTAYYCAGCKRWLCIERRILKDTQNTDFDLYMHNVRGKDKTFLKVCYHQAHQANWQQKQY